MQKPQRHPLLRGDELHDVHALYPGEPPLLRGGYDHRRRLPEGGGSPGEGRHRRHRPQRHRGPAQRQGPGGLHRPGHDGGCGPDEPDDRHDSDLCGRRGRHQPAGGGHWGDEHYAGFGKRAHAGNWHPQVPGGQNRGDSPAVFDRGGHPLPLWGDDRPGAGVPGELWHLRPGGGGARF